MGNEVEEGSKQLSVDALTLSLSLAERTTCATSYVRSSSCRTSGRVACSWLRGWREGSVGKNVREVSVGGVSWGRLRRRGAGELGGWRGWLAGWLSPLVCEGRSGQGQEGQEGQEG